MKFHALHFRWFFRDGSEYRFIFGLCIGRVGFLPEAKWLYSFRVYLGLCSIEILWRTGIP